MGLFDLFKKKKADDGMYHRDPGRESSDVHYGGTGSSQGYGYGTSFRLTVQDVFSITGRGTVITGTVEAGLDGGAQCSFKNVR